MRFEKRMKQAWENAGKITLYPGERLVIMSDLHRGAGSGSDNFAKNHMLYHGALCYYYREGYAYLELGDGDELWENTRIEDIYQEYPCVFETLERFRQEKRFFTVFGNHDKKKRKLKGVLEAYLIERKDKKTFFLALHGHQGDTLNDTFSPVAHFLVRFIWAPLERIGFRNPAEGSFNGNFRSRQEDRLTRWAAKNNQPVIAGHTHAERFSLPGEAPYFNCGCGVKNGEITAIEFDKEKLFLVKWKVVPDCQGYLKIAREIVKEADLSEE